MYVAGFVTSVSALVEPMTSRTARDAELSSTRERGPSSRLKTSIVGCPRPHRGWCLTGGGITREKGVRLDLTYMGTWRIIGDRSSCGVDFSGHPLWKGRAE